MSDADTWRSIPQEIFTDGREDLIDEYFGVDYVEHAKLPPGIGPGREGFRQFVSAFRSAFPDGRYEVLLQTQDGDLHTGLVAVEGTMTGDFLGMPASGKKARWEEMHIGRAGAAPVGLALYRAPVEQLFDQALGQRVRRHVGSVVDQPPCLRLVEAGAALRCV